MGIVDFVVHFDKHLLEFVRVYGSWVYAILFSIVFAETGLVVTPFLPGDSLLFATGALCATGVLDLTAIWALLVFAAFTGNATNYSIGRFIGPRVFGESGSGFRQKLNRNTAGPVRTCPQPRSQRKPSIRWKRNPVCS